jgi:hypothetical protein
MKPNAPPGIADMRQVEKPGNHRNGMVDRHAGQDQCLGDLVQHHHQAGDQQKRFCPQRGTGGLRTAFFAGEPGRLSGFSLSFLWHS